MLLGAVVGAALGVSVGATVGAALDVVAGAVVGASIALTSKQVLTIAKTMPRMKLLVYLGEDQFERFIRVRVQGGGGAECQTRR
jgi:outer membrane lipoprotein SlyB